MSEKKDAFEEGFEQGWNAIMGPVGGCLGFIMAIVTIVFFLSLLFKGC